MDVLLLTVWWYENRIWSVVISKWIDYGSTMWDPLIRKMNEGEVG